ncbi:MAG: DUF6049 family protein [Actinobacteria bacterium]|nr:DUF6049 family protein [Actinomycetota bacterium]
MRLKTLVAPLLAAVAISTFASTTLVVQVQAQQVQPVEFVQGVLGNALRLTAQNFHIYTSGTLRFVFTVDDPTLLKNLFSNPNSVVRVSLGSMVVGGEKEVRELISTPGRFVAIDTLDFSLNNLRKRADQQIEISASTTDLKADTQRIEFGIPGIYPVRIEVLINNVVQADVTSFVNRASTIKNTDPMPVNVVVVLDSSNTLQLDGSHIVNDQTREKFSKLIALLESDGPLISVQISGQAIDGLSKSKNPKDQALLVQLIAALGTTTLVESTYVQFDPSSARQSDHDKDFKALLDLGKKTLQALSPKNTITNNVWIAKTPLDQDGLDLLAESGYDSILMLPNSSKSLGVFDNTARPYRLVSGTKTLSLHVVDPSYVAQISDLKNNSFVDASTIAAQLLAQRNKIESDGGTPSLRWIVLTSQDGSVVNSDLLHEVLLILKRVPLQISIQTLKNISMPRQDAFKPTLRPANSTLFVDRIKDLDLLRTDLDKLKSSIGENSEQWAKWNERLLALSSENLSSSDFADFIGQTRGELKALRTAVTLQEGTTFTLGSRESQLRLDLQNSSEQDMDVQVRVVSPKLRFTKSAAIIRVPANGSSELVVDVVALSNGLFPVEIRIFTADGLSQLGKKIEVSARVNAIAGLGQVVSGVALLLLVTWWIAHIRRRYRKQISKNHPVLRSKP